MLQGSLLCVLFKCPQSMLRALFVQLQQQAQSGRTKWFCLSITAGRHRGYERPALPKAPATMPTRWNLLLLPWAAALKPLEEVAQREAAKNIGPPGECTPTGPGTAGAVTVPAPITGSLTGKECKVGPPEGGGFWQTGGGDRALLARQLKRRQESLGRVCSCCPVWLLMRLMCAFRHGREGKNTGLGGPRCHGVKLQ